MKRYRKDFRKPPVDKSMIAAGVLAALSAAFILISMAVTYSRYYHE